MGDENCKWIVGRPNRKIDKRRSGHCISRFSYDCREVASGELPTHIAGHCVSFFGEYSEVLPITCRQAQWASRFIDLLSSKLGVRWGWVVKNYAQQELLCQFEEAGLVRGQVWKSFGEEKIHYPHRSSKPGWICSYNLFIYESNMTTPKNAFEKLKNINDLTIQ